jgi:hypothetical protein
MTYSELRCHSSGDFRSVRPFAILFFLFVILLISSAGIARTSKLKAGVAKVNITNMGVPLINDTLYVKALVLDDGAKKIVIITVDAVAIGEIGYIKNDYLPKVRAALEKELKIKPENVLVNASHCHGVICSDVDQRTILAVKMASMNMVPVDIGSGTGYEDRIMENRRMKLKSGREADSRHAYSLPPDEEVIGVGPVDPEIGILRLDRKNGKTLAVLYNFAVHPIQGVPNGGNTADISGFASKTVEDCLSNGAIALFVQGCAGDINPVMYKDVNNPRDAEPLGNMLGISTIKALNKIVMGGNNELKMINETIELPRASLAGRINEMQAEQAKLLQSLSGTTLNLKTFYTLVNKYNFSPEFPSNYSHRYLHDNIMGRSDLARLDELNRNNIESYLRNIYIMEQLTRNQININLLKMHEAQNKASGSNTITVEVVGIRIGDFVLVSFPGELSSQTGLNIKKISPHELTFIAGISNGYIYYTPTDEQLKNSGFAQEDSDCIVAPGWQKIFETRILEILKKL